MEKISSEMTECGIFFHTRRLMWPVKRKMRLQITMGMSVVSLVALTAPQAVLSKGLTADAVNGATFSHQALKKADRTPIMVKLQLLLDRAQFSPGLIDGRRGSNVSQALAAYEAAHGL